MADDPGRDQGQQLRCERLLEGRELRQPTSLGGLEQMIRTGQRDHREVVIASRLERLLQPCSPAASQNDDIPGAEHAECRGGDAPPIGGRVGSKQAGEPGTCQRAKLGVDLGLREGITITQLSANDLGLSIMPGGVVISHDLLDPNHIVGHRCAIHLASEGTRTDRVLGGRSLRTGDGLGLVDERVRPEHASGSQTHDKGHLGGLGSDARGVEATLAVTQDADAVAVHADLLPEPAECRGPVSDEVVDGRRGVHAR